MIQHHRARHIELDPSLFEALSPRNAQWHQILLEVLNHVDSPRNSQCLEAGSPLGTSVPPLAGS